MTLRSIVHQGGRIVGWEGSPQSAAVVQVLREFCEETLPGALHRARLSLPLTSGTGVEFARNSRKPTSSGGGVFRTASTLPRPPSSSRTGIGGGSEHLPGDDGVEDDAGTNGARTPARSLSPTVEQDAPSRAPSRALSRAPSPLPPMPPINGGEGEQDDVDRSSTPLFIREESPLTEDEQTEDADPSCVTAVSYGTSRS